MREMKERIRVKVEGRRRSRHVGVSESGGERVM